MRGYFFSVTLHLFPTSTLNAIKPTVCSVIVNKTILHPPLPQDGATALIMASKNGHEEVVRLLLQSGAEDFPYKIHKNY